MEGRRILIGLQDWVLRHETFIYAGDCGYDADFAQGEAEMLAHIRTTDYQRVVMDLNLGLKEELDISPALSVHTALKPSIAVGLMKFLAISQYSRVVRAAKEKNIPARITRDLDLEEFFGVVA